MKTPPPDPRADADLLVRFAAGELDPAAFRHADHLRVAWLLLRRDPVAVALEKLTCGLRGLATKAGKPGVYHETITWAYAFLLHERLAAAPPGEGWTAFAGRCPELFAWPSPLLERLYRPETLASDTARRAFVMPDRLALSDR